MQRPDLIIFKQGEKAKAAEVNQNFEELGDYIQGSVGEMNTTVTNAVSSLQTLVNSAAPTGVVQAYAGNTVPSGWLLCDGSAVSRTQYSGLFNVISTTYGSGDGSTTFNLPNLLNKFIEGSNTAGTEKSAGLPNLKWTFPTGKHATGAGWDGGSGVWYSTYSINANDINPIYRDEINTVQPPALTMKYIIKT